MLRVLFFPALAACSRSVSKPAPGVVEMPGVVRFYFDGTHVTLSLLTEKEWMWRRPDDTYRLDARWVGDDLQYRPPFGKWTLLATLHAGHFEEPGTTDSLSPVNDLREG